MDDWLIVDRIEDVLVGTSIPYNYEKSKFQYKFIMGVIKRNMKKKIRYLINRWGKWRWKKLRKL